MKDLDSIYFTARELPAEGRSAYLKDACQGDDALRLRVERMLSVSAEAEAFITDPPEARVVGKARQLDLGEAGSVEGEGSQVGPYILRQQIGEGGFGTVWMAEQSEPIRRMVALKVVKAGMDTREVLARFGAERQALAMMDHPNIAKVLDAGATASGRPYFAMELVRGIPITQFCDDQKFGVRQRLELFRDVCAAVNHAHQKGVIHRDIKPSNVMVTLHGDKPVAKVIDFGIAKATQGRLTDQTLFTRFEQFLGTPAYMSPEQAAMSGLDVDTRSDIYSLGVLLYTLLVGQPPFDVQTLLSAGYDEMRRIIKEDEPPRPSTRLTQTRAKAGTAHSNIAPSALKGELDWIVMKAIEKDRARRYETASDLAADIGRYLSDEPVHAVAAGAAYAFRKFARRHRAALGAAIGILAMLITATSVSLWQAVRATRAEQRARESASIAQREATRASEQKGLAERNLIQAQAAQREATEQRIRADRQTEVAEENLYDAQMHLAVQTWREHRGLPRMRELLAKWIPRKSSKDRRGWEWYYLNSLPYQDLRTFTESGSGLNPSTVAWHVGTKRLAEGLPDGVIRIWDADREQATLVIRGPAAWVPYWGSSWLDWNTDGSQLAAGARDGTVHVWATPSGQELRVLRGLPSAVVSIAYSADGSRIAAWGEDGQIKIWDSRTGVLAAETTHPGAVSSGAWSPDDKLLATGHFDGTVSISGARAGARITALRAHVDTIYHLAWSPDSSRLASTSANDFFVSVWDVASEKVVLGPLRHSHGITSIAWEPNGNRLATGSMDETVKIWDTDTGREAATLRGNTQAVTSLSWGPDGRLASGCADGSMRVWDFLRDQESCLLPGHALRAMAVAWSPNGKRLASGGDDGKVRIWNPATREEVLSIKTHDRGESIDQIGLIRSVAWSPDGTRIASSGQNGAIKVCEVASGRELLALPAEHGCVWCVAWSPDGERLAAGAEDGTIRVIEGIKPGAAIHAYQGHKTRVRSLAWSPNGDRLASGAWQDSRVKIWDPVRRAELASLNGHRGSVLKVAWNLDGKRLASASSDFQVIAWDVATGQKLSTLRGHNDFVDSVAWSPDGTRLASASLDNSVRIWDPRRGEETFVLRGKSGMFHDVAWSPEGARLAAASSDGHVWIWDATRGFERDAGIR
ncbi:MAG: serine/threonine protein kinase [Verrucomicrobia bacterium]|nr:serine/threonine protein kinase [Verrucomicrobiota bacterium]MBI3868407.1 serine/threonine protein kinase [Verrucomicrobiota bacterium]